MQKNTQTYLLAAESTHETDPDSNRLRRTQQKDVLWNQHNDWSVLAREAIGKLVVMVYVWNPAAELVDAFI